MTAQMCDDASYDTNLRTELLYLHNEPENPVVENNNKEKELKEKTDDVQGAVFT